MSLFQHFQLLPCSTCRYLRAYHVITHFTPPNAPETAMSSGGPSQSSNLPVETSQRIKDPPFQHQKWRLDLHLEAVVGLHRARLHDPIPTARARRLQPIAVVAMIRALRRVLDPGRDQSLRLVAMAETGVAVVTEAVSVVEIAARLAKVLPREPPRLVYPQLMTFFRGHWQGS